METQTILTRSTYEQTLIGIVRTLPLERVTQVVDFARFLQTQPIDGYADERIGDETDEEILASEEKWDHLFATPESQQMMRKMAAEALAEDDAELTIEMAFDRDGNLIEPA